MKMTKRKVIRLWIIGGCCLALAGIGVGVGELTAQAGPTPAQPSTSVPVDPAKASQQSALANNEANAEAVAKDPAKMRVETSEKAAAAAAAASASVVEATQIPTIQDICSPGLLNEAPPYKGADFSGVSGDVQIINGECMMTWVGQAGSGDSQDGAVLIITTSINKPANGKSYAPGQDKTSMQVQVVTVPGSGPLTVDGAAPGLVYATSKAGKAYTVHDANHQVKAGRG